VILGIIFLTWITLMHALVFPGGIIGFDWIWMGLTRLNRASDGSQNLLISGARGK
jgi:hypothetical protein